MSTQLLPKTLGSFILFFLKKHKLGLFVFFAVALIWSIELSISPYLLKLIIDGVNQQAAHPGQLLSVILWPAIFYAGMSVFLNITFRIYDWMCLILFPKIKTDIIMATFTYLSQHSYNYFQENFAGSLAKKIQDLAQSTEPVIKVISEMFVPRAMAIFMASFMLAIVSPIFSAILFVWATIFIAVSSFLALYFSHHATEYAESYSQLNGSLVDSISNITTSKIFANEHFEESRINASLLNVNIKDRTMQRSMMKLYFIQGIGITFLVTFMLITLIYGRMHGWITVGDFAFVLSLSFSISMTIWDLAQQLVRFTQDIGKCQQALSIITPTPAIQDQVMAKPLVIYRGEIHFNHIHFSYLKNRTLFKEFSLLIPAGQKIGLVGFSGSGKSTFAKLILRLFDLQFGSILIDNQDIKTVTQRSLRQQIAMIPQEPESFHRTIMENIRYGRPDATDTEVITAAEKAHCDEFIQQLPENYQALVGERGVKLSGGQRQRIAIARAILKAAPILILDEATSSLDSATEHHIQQGLHSLMNNKTTIVIAHRLSTLQKMDRILFFKDGAIIEDGTLEELRAKNGYFAKLWDMQSGGYLPQSLNELIHESSFT